MATFEVTITRFEDRDPPDLAVQVGDTQGYLSVADTQRLGVDLISEAAYCAEAARWIQAARQIGLSERTIGRLLAAREEHQEKEG